MNKHVVQGSEWKMRRTVYQCKGCGLKRLWSPRCPRCKSFKKDKVK